MKILVTGATGFVGTYLVRELERQEHEIHAVSRRFTGVYGKYIIWHPCNLIDIEQVKKLPKDIDLIYHLASQQPNTPDITFEEFLKGNVMITYNIKKYYPFTRIIYLSTTATLCSWFHYSITKKFGEMLMDNDIIIRFPAIVGKEYKGLLSYIYTQAKENKDIELYNNGQAIRSFIHIDDVIKILTPFVFDYFDYTKRTICTRGGLTVKDIAKYIIAKCNSSSKIVNKESIMGNLDEGKITEPITFIERTLLETIDKYIEEMEHEH